MKVIRKILRKILVVFTITFIGISFWVVLLGVNNIYKASSLDSQLCEKYTVIDRCLNNSSSEENKEGSSNFNENSKNGTNNTAYSSKPDETEIPSKPKESNKINEREKLISELIRKLENKGVFGDSAGLLTAAFTGLAFLGVLFTLYWQDKYSKRQSFEDNFFNMLKTQESIISNLVLRIEKRPDLIIASRQIFRHIFDENFKKNADIEQQSSLLSKTKLSDIAKENYQLINSNKVSLNENICETIGTIYWKIENIEILSHYFTFMYRIIKFVDESKILSDGEKSNYIDILRATLSTYELLMLFYNAIINHPKMKKLIIRYEIFENISYNLLPKNLYKLYIIKNNNGKNSSAYGDRLKEIIKYNFSWDNKK